MAGFQEIADFLGKCSLYKPNDRTYIKTVKDIVMPIIPVLCELMDTRKCSSDDFLVILFEHLKRKKYSQLDIVQATQAICNFHTLIQNSIHIASNFKVNSYGISDTIDFIGSNNDETYISLFDYRDISFDFLESYKLQAAARAYNSSNDLQINTLIYSYLLTGKNVMCTYDEYDNIEVIAQAIDSNGKVKRRSSLCKTCTLHDKCFIVYT